MSIEIPKSDFPAIPEKRYFNIGEVSRLCRVEQHVLRYWEKFFPELQPIRRGNRRYYQRQDIYLVRQIQDLLRRQGYTIDGAQRQLARGAVKSEWIFSKEIIRELQTELKELLQLLKT